MNATAQAAQTLHQACSALNPQKLCAHVYQPLGYAWEAHAAYANRYGSGNKRILFMGMNPGPFGMAQTGIPFGEVAAVKDWMDIEAPLNSAHLPENPHPKKPIEGFACTRSEVSGRRLWGLFKERFESAHAFFEDHYVLNYCPLLLLTETGRNITPDKLPAADTRAVFEACNIHLRSVVHAQNVQCVVGLGNWAHSIAVGALKGQVNGAGKNIRIEKCLHPSPASPAANRGWAGAATKTLVNLGLWPA